MKKIDLGQAIQIGANLGVVLGIIFLAIEVSQNTSSVDLQREMALWSLRLDATDLMLENPDVRQAMLKFNAGGEELTPEERLLVSGNVGRRFEIASFVYRNYPDLLQQAERPCVHDMPARIREIWEQRKSGLDPGFVQLAEDCEDSGD